MGQFDYRTYWNERLKGVFGLEAVGYRGLGRSFNMWMYRLRERVFLQRVRSLGITLDELDVLDVGSGSGFYVSLWRKLKARNITGIDISEQAIMNLRHRFPENGFRVLDLTSDNAIEKQYHCISCMDVLFHVVDEQRFCRAISNLSRMLMKGGYLIISDNFLHNDAQYAQHHVSRTLVRYQAILRDNGFRIVTRRPMFYFLNYPVDSRNTILHFIWKFILAWVPGREYLGYMVGMSFYPIDRVLVSLLKEGPSSEIMICEKQE